MIWNGSKSQLFPSNIQNKALRKLSQLDASQMLSDLKKPPGNRLKSLTGNRKGQMSIWINTQWRICFRWEGADAHDVEIVDYHK